MKKNLSGHFDSLMHIGGTLHFFSMKILYQNDWIIESVYTVKDKNTQKMKFMITINDKVGPANLHFRK